MRTDCPTPEELRALLKALPSPAPARAQVAQVRERVLAQAAVARRRDRLRTGLFVSLALAAGAVLAIGLRGPSANVPEARYHGTITAPASARFTRVSPAPDELVVLESGTLHVEVSRLGQGERFRVRAGDGEVEVRGTAFDVTADGGRLSRVEVEHGRVEVRSPGAARAVLDAGQGWAVSERSAAAHTMSQAPGNEPATDAPPSTAVVSPHPVSKRVAPSGANAPGAATSAAPSDPPKPEPDVAARAVVPAPSPSVAPSARRAPAPALAGSAGPGDSTEAPATSDRARDDNRRERRDERRERHDQRRIR